MVSKSATGSRVGGEDSGRECSAMAGMLGRVFGSIDELSGTEFKISDDSTGLRQAPCAGEVRRVQSTREKSAEVKELRSVTRNSFQASQASSELITLQ